jgi:hypothetical protein
MSIARTASKSRNSPPRKRKRGGRAYRDYRGEDIARMSDAEIDRLLDQRLTERFIDLLSIEALRRLRMPKPKEEERRKLFRKFTGI